MTISAPGLAVELMRRAPRGRGVLFSEIPVPVFALILLLDNDGRPRPISLRDVRRTFRLAQTSTHDLVAKATGLGLITQQRAKSDARLLVLSLTAKAQRILHSATIHCKDLTPGPSPPVERRQTYDRRRF